jgi:hypothetical protein
MTTVLKHIRAIILLPVMATIVIPAAIIATSGTESMGWSAPFPFGFVAQAAGILLIGLGLVLMANTIALFARLGGSDREARRARRLSLRPQPDD